MPLVSEYIVIGLVHLLDQADVEVILQILPTSGASCTTSTPAFVKSSAGPMPESSSKCGD